MQIKRYVAATMREAIAQVREEQGPDAVILSNRRIEEGMEVIAAIDYDETLISQAMAPGVARNKSAVAPERQAQPAATASSEAGNNASAPAAPAKESFLATLRGRRANVVPELMPEQAASNTAVAGKPQQTIVVKDKPTAAPSRPNASARAPANAITAGLVAAATASASAAPSALVRTAGEKIVALQDPAIARMREEMQAMRQLLESQLAGLAWNELGRRQPLKAKVLRDLAALDIQPEIARQIVAEMPDIKNMQESWKVPLGLLARRIPVSDDDILEHGGIVAVVGPTGVGKTTTIAKIAARFALKHGARNVALISTDTYRIGAREQLATYARILNVPMHVAQDREDLANLIEAVRDRKLILIDTAGMSQRDLRLGEQFNTLYNERARIKVILALSATNDPTCLDETVRLFERFKPSSCVLTKLDEAASLGGALSVLIRHGLPLTYICDGQRVPEDLHSAHGKRGWLVQTAVKLRRQSGRTADEATLADQFGKVAAYA